MSAAIQKTNKQKVDTLMGALVERKQTFQTLLPEGMRVEWFLSEVRVAVARAPGLAECTNVSVVDALTTCAQLGLSPSGRLGSAYLIPYKDKCTLVVGYRGYVDLAYRSGDVATFHAEVVHERDQFTHEEGLSPVLRHVRSEDENPGALRAAYAIAHMKDGSVSHVVMYRREVLAIKARSRASGSGPWVTDEGEMWRKTALRRLIKLLPLSPTRAKDLFRAEETEREQEEALDAEFTTEDAPKSGIQGAKEAARKALEAKTAGTVAAEVSDLASKGHEMSEKEKAAILTQEMALAEPGSEG
jgi:recombination protein RecT